MNAGGNNRRRFFRIVDSLGVSYRVITETEIQQQKNPDTKEQPSQLVDRLSLLQSYNDTIMQSIEMLTPEHPEAANGIAALNKKFDALLMMLDLDGMVSQRACHRIAEASISASGIAFPVDDALDEGTLLALDLLLRPSSAHVKAVGKVVACDHVPDESLYYLRVDFTEIEHQDREQLIQHIVQRQGVLLRALKDEMEKNEEE